MLLIKSDDFEDEVNFWIECIFFKVWTEYIVRLIFVQSEKKNLSSYWFDKLTKSRIARNTLVRPRGTSVHHRNARDEFSSEYSSN